MTLWLLEPNYMISGSANRERNPWEPWYDKCFGMVVRAPDEQEARRIAAECASDEACDWAKYHPTMPNPWLDAELSTCVLVSDDGPAELVLQSIHAA